MTDIEVMHDMLKRAAIEFSEHTEQVGSEAMPIGTVTLKVEDGYPCFFAAMNFKPDGTLLRISAWE